MTTAENEQGAERRPSETHIHEHHTHIDASANRQLYIMIGSIAVIGGLGAVSYGVFQSTPQLAEAAASGLAMFFIQFVLLLFKKGVIALPGGDDALPTIQGGIRKGWREIQALIARSSTLVLLLITAGYALGFLAVRHVVWTLFTTFDSPWIIGGICALAAAPFIIPGALSAIFRALKVRK